MNKDLEKIIKEIECYQNEDMCLIMLSQKENKTLLDYITNLQQENHELKSKLECYENGVYYSSKVDELEQENEDYKSRCEKAIEYNKEIVNNYLEEDNCEYCDGRYATAKHNLNILQNGSENDE